MSPLKSIIACCVLLLLSPGPLWAGKNAPHAAPQTQPLPPPESPRSAPTADTLDEEPTDSAPAPSGPEEVSVGIHINDIEIPDLLTQSCEVGFDLWLRWKAADLDPLASLEFVNLYEGWEPGLSPGIEAPREMADGSRYLPFRYRGTFRCRLSLQNYPFDTQEILVDIRDREQDSSQLLYVQDEKAISLAPGLSVTGYRLGEPTMLIMDYLHRDNPGEGSHGDARLFSQVSLKIPLHRNPWPTIVKLFLPLLLVTLSAVLIFYIQPRRVESRIGLGVLALLTLVIMQFNNRNLLPQVDYLIMVDFLFAVAYLFVGFGLIHAVRTSWMIENNTTEAIVRHDGSLLRYALIVLVLTILEILAQYLL